MPAIIVFADGSKQMAHNLDDQRFRWHERKHVESEIRQSEPNDGLAIRDCSDPSSLHEAIVWRSELVAQNTYINNVIQVLKATEFENRDEREQALLLPKMAKKEIEAQLAVTNGFIKLRDSNMAQERLSLLKRKNASIEKQREEKEQKKKAHEEQRMIAQETKDQKNAERLQESLALNRQLSSENRTLREQLISAQAEIIRLQRLLIQQFGLAEEIVCPIVGD